MLPHAVGCPTRELANSLPSGLFNDSKWVGRVLVVVAKPLQSGTEDGMFGHPTWNAFALMPPNSRFLNNHAHSRVATRNGSLLQILKHIAMAIEVARFGHGHVN